MLPTSRCKKCAPHDLTSHIHVRSSQNKIIHQSDSSRADSYLPTAAYESGSQNNAFILTCKRSRACLLHFRLEAENDIDADDSHRRTLSVCCCCNCCCLRSSTFLPNTNGVITKHLHSLCKNIKDPSKKKALASHFRLTATKSNILKESTVPAFCSQRSQKKSKVVLTAPLGVQLTLKSADVQTNLNCSYSSTSQ